ncbi:D-glycerate dehydrogenase [Oceanobacillus kimchii]|uniref:2-hydroxyacid dehydrogenase n=1 Tax=Oceanobacillus kimchii TaxID=746691 RepID=UPI0021A5AA6E|nr:D-glycerate dehydrogenase [Oceanobacillus kimchii]MCT1578394.1 D-glycerate dehydrogenase [Oceanobacillus kimchii]MCT2134572.1 D-glycerate dehydrogenase [Oceanobacillus kimchii]
MKREIILYKSIPNDLLEQLTNYFIVHQHQHKSEMDDYFISDLQRVEGIIGSKLRVDQQLLVQAPRLKIVTNMSVGYDNLDIEELTKRGIMATNTPDVLTDTVADMVLGLLLAASRRICELDQYVKLGRWDENIGEHLFGVDVHHKTLGIIGMGRIGLAIAERAHYGFKMKIVYHNRSTHSYAEKNLQANYASLEELLKVSDFILVMAPLVPETVKLIGEKEFSLMKETAIFLNGSRGELVDETALIHALQSKKILGAGLDVYEQEPISKDSPLLQMKNVVTLPHIGSATKDTRYQMAKLAVENLIKGLTGEVPPSLINPDVLKNNSKKENDSDG